MGLLASWREISYQQKSVGNNYYRNNAGQRRDILRDLIENGKILSKYFRFNFFYVCLTFRVFLGINIEYSGRALT